MIKIEDINDKAVVSIKPIKPNLMSSETAIYLGVRISNDNMLNSACFEWCVYTEALNPLISAVVICENEDYEKWDNSNEQAFEYVLKNVPQIQLDEA